MKVGKRTTSVMGWEAAEKEQQAWEFGVKVAISVRKFGAPCESASSREVRSS